MIAAEAPSNIALIKYMGKVSGASTQDRNRPTNPSLSVTLPHLRTRVELSPNGATKDSWAPLAADGWLVPAVGEKGQIRFLNHFAKMKSAWKIQGFYQVRSASNFPSDCGLASSASSFAALTMATAQLALEQNPQLDLTQDLIADFSRQGSGSSIRSFYDGFCIWDDKGAREIQIRGFHLHHEVVVVEDGKKHVSSSEAHERVLTSPLFDGRPQRAEHRLTELVRALENKNWRDAFRVTWDEFHDMHALFSTSQPPFSYMTTATEDVLEYLHDYWQRHSDGPLVTMDAGANVHLLYREDHRHMSDEIRRAFTAKGYRTL